MWGEEHNWCVFGAKSHSDGEVQDSCELKGTLRGEKTEGMWEMRRIPDLQKCPLEEAWISPQSHPAWFEEDLAALHSQPWLSSASLSPDTSKDGDAEGEGRWGCSFCHHRCFIETAYGTAPWSFKLCAVGWKRALTAAPGAPGHGPF